MKSRTLRTVCLTSAFLIMTLPLLARQRGSDPVTGTWTGDWGPSPSDRNTVSVDLKLAGKNVTGVVHSINYQRPDVMLLKSKFDSAKGEIHMEADAPNPRGGAPVHYVIDGRLMGGTLSGSWNHGPSKGDFKLTKK